MWPRRCLLGYGDVEVAKWSCSSGDGERGRASFLHLGRDRNENDSHPGSAGPVGWKVSRSSDAGASPGRSQQHWILVMCILARNPTSPAPVIAKGRLLRGARALRAVGPAARAAWEFGPGLYVSQLYTSLTCQDLPRLESTLAFLRQVRVNPRLRIFAYLSPLVGF